MARAQTQNRGGYAGPSRSVENMEAEFDEMDRLAQRGPSRGGAEHLRLASGPRQPAVHPGPGQYWGPSAADLERLVRGARRAAIFAAVMSTLALIMALFAALVGVAGLAV